MRDCLADHDPPAAQWSGATAVRLLRELSGDELRRLAASRPAGDDRAHAIVADAITEALEASRAAMGPTGKQRPAHRRPGQRVRTSFGCVDGTKE
jgi:hypothetical protein